MQAVDLKKFWLVLVCAPLVCLTPLPSIAQQPAGTGTTRNTSEDVAPGTTPAKSGPATPAIDAPTSPALPILRVADLAWLQGQWVASWGPRTITQAWVAPKAGTIVGTLQEVEGDKTLVIELITLTDTPHSIEYRERRFTPSLTPWEGKGPDVLNLMSVDARKVVFQNQLDEGQPQQIILMHTDPDTYINRWIILPQAGDPQPVEVTFHRQKLNVGSGAHR